MTVALMKDLIAQLETDGKPDLDTLIDALSSEIELFHRLADTEQEPEWHGEGDVLTHTRMVLQQTYAQLPIPGLTGTERAALILAAALHDIAKPLATRRKEFHGRERIVSPRHADLGRSYLAPQLLALGLEPALAFDVLALVGHHHDVLKLLRGSKHRRGNEHRGDDHPGGFWRLARLASVTRLYLLEVADIRGRICADLEDQLEMLELFRLGVEDAGITNDQPPHLAWREAIEGALASETQSVRKRAYAQALLDAESGTIRSAEEAIARAYQHRDQHAELTVLCGPSGSGKSTWAARNAPEATVISLDDMRVELTGRRDSRRREGQVAQEAKRRLKEAFARGDHVVWDATCLARTRRDEVCQRGFAYGAYVNLVAFVGDHEGLRRRNQSRQHPVPTNVLERQVAGFDLPYADEAHEVQWLNLDHEILSSTAPGNP